MRPCVDMKIDFIQRQSQFRFSSLTAEKVLKSSYSIVVWRNILHVWIFPHSCLTSFLQFHAGERSLRRLWLNLAFHLSKSLHTIEPYHMLPKILLPVCPHLLNVSLCLLSFSLRRKYYDFYFSMYIFFVACEMVGAAAAYPPPDHIL